MIFIAKLQVANDKQCNFSLEEYEESGVKNDWEWFVVDRDRYGKARDAKALAHILIIKCLFIIARFEYPYVGSPNSAPCMQFNPRQSATQILDSIL